MKLTNEQWDRLDGVIDQWVDVFEAGAPREKLEDFSLAVLKEFLPPLTIGHVDNGSGLAAIYEATGTVMLAEGLDKDLNKGT